MMLKGFLAATALVASFSAVPASAAPVLVRFAGVFDNDGTSANNNGSYTADVTLDVVNGMAQSGSGLFTFQNATRALSLVTVNTPGNHNTDPNYPVGLISNNGDNVFGADQIYPLTSIGGLLFAIDTTMPADGQNALINFYNDSGTLKVGAYGTLAGSVRLYTGGTLAVTALPSATGAVPEPATWGMMILGLGMVGAAMRRRVRASEVRFNTKIKQISGGATA